MLAQADVSIVGDSLLLSGRLDYDTVVDIDRRGRQWLQGAAPQDCAIDLSGVLYSGSVGLALLLGWLRVAEQQQKTLRIRQLPANMAALAKLGGLEKVLD